MGSTSVLQRLGSKASEYANKAKSLPPTDEEAKSLKEKQENVNAVSKSAPAAPKEEESKGDPLPQGRYGSRPGEKRLDWAMKPMVPVYDGGGEVSTLGKIGNYAKGTLGKLSQLGKDEAPANTAQPAAKTSSYDPLKDLVSGVKNRIAAHKPVNNIHETMNVNTGKPSSSLPPLVPAITPTPLAPLYDEGGDVDVNDGKHQVAILEDGERVLTPEENEQYKKEHPEAGAPADFGGRVLSNPKGLKPILDTDIEKERASDTDRLPKGTSLNIEKAPLKTPEGDISNPPAADVQPEMMREMKSTSTDKALKPYSQVVEEKAKAKAAEQVNNPGVQPSTSDVTGQVEEKPVAEEKPKATLGQALAQDWLKKIGASTGDVTSKLEKPEGLAPSGSPQATPEAAAPQGGMKPIVQPEGPKLAGKEAYKAKIKQYDDQYQSLLDQAAKNNDPSLREQAARVQEAKLDYMKQHPAGTPESAHPGVLGKIGHVANDIAGRARMASIALGTTPEAEKTYGLGEKQAAARQESKDTTAEATARQAADAKENKATADKYTLKEIVDTRPDSPTKGQHIYAGVNNTDPTDIRYTPLQTVDKGTTGQDKKAFQDILKKVGSPDVADPAQQKQALETAHNTKGPDGQPVISDDEYKTALAYLGSTSNAPATQATATQEKRTAGKTMYFNTPEGRKALTAAEAKAQGFDPNEGVVENEAQVAKDREKNSTYRVIKNSLTQYQKDVAKAQITPDDITTMTTMTEESEKPDYISKLIGGAFDDLLGHPITGYSEKLMKGTLTKNQYQNMTPAARQLLADYYTTMMAHIANMKATQGTIPRSPYIITTEMHTIPKPFLNEEEAKPSFQNYLDQVAMRNVDNVDFGGATGVPKEPSVAPPAGATDEVVVGGKVVGHVVTGNDGKKVYQPLQ